MQFRRTSQAILLAAFAGAAVAAPSVTFVEGSGTVDQNSQNMAGRWEIEVTTTATSTPTTWLITSNAGDDIAYIRVRNTTSQVTFVRVESNGANGLLDVDAIERYDSTRNVVLLNLDIYGNLGNVGVTNIVTGRVRGDAVGDITLVERQDAGNSPITDFWIEGDLLGNVTTEWGEVTNLRVDGDFGSSVVNVDMQTRDGIKVLRIGGSCYADINANAFSVNSAVGRIEIGAEPQGGDFLGTLTATAPSSFSSTVANPGLYLREGTSADGDLVGDITFTSAMSDRILIDGSFASGATITLPSNGLTGQITFNANDDGGAWAGTLTVDSTTYGEGYSALPSAIGGGAAGKAPFAMHESTASPANPHYVFITGIDIHDPMMECYDIPFSGEISFRLYGPASIESGTGTPAKVQINSSGWTDDFDIDAEIVSSTGSRGLKFVRKSGGTPIAWPQVFGEYRIVPKADRIVSVDVTGEPTVEFEYYIELLDGCGLMLLQNYDLNSDDDVCMEDMGWWLDTPVDLNGDEEADSADAALLLRAIDIYQNR